MLSIGRDIVKGIWNGIKGAGSWLKTQISSFASGVVEGFKSSFKINSPSRIMRDLIGVNLIKGIGVGMENEENSLLKTAKSMVASLISTMSVDGANMFNLGGSMALASDIGSSISNNTTTNYGALLHVDNVVINDDKDIETLANELAFYIKRKDIIPV